MDVDDNVKIRLERVKIALGCPIMFAAILRYLRYARVYLPHGKVANTPFHIKGDDKLKLTSSFLALRPPVCLPPDGMELLVRMGWLLLSDGKCALLKKKNNIRNVFSERAKLI